jgi:nitrogen fixation protein FixH
MNKTWVWIAIVGVLAVVVVAANLILAWVAVSDPSFAVEEDYYQKAMAWDEKRAQDRRNAELGWTLEFEMAQRHAADGTLELSARLRDAAGEGLTGVRIGVEAFHNARASHVLHATLSHGDGGLYSAPLAIYRPGLWEFRFEAQRGDQRFTHVEVREVGWR